MWALVQIVMGASKPSRTISLWAKGEKEENSVVSKLPRLFLVFTRIFQSGRFIVNLLSKQLKCYSKSDCRAATRIKN